MKIDNRGKMKDKHQTCIVGILRGNFRHKRYCNYPTRDSIINPERLVNIHIEGSYE